MQYLSVQMRQWCSYLHIAEKNSIAKSVSAILAQGRQRIGSTLSKYNQTYEFTMDGESHVFSSVTGHLFSKRLPQYCKDWQNYDNSLILTRAVNIEMYLEGDMKNVSANIQQLAKRATRLILWLDCDREGQAIAFEVIRLVKAVNSTIQIDRARFLAVTEEDVMRAYRNLVKPNNLEADAVNYREQLDFRTGCAFTRFQTVSIQRSFGIRTMVISYGLCQIPTLSIVVDRYLEIINFKPEKYWTIDCTCVITDDAYVDFKWTKKNLRNQIQANAIFARIYQKANTPEGLKGKVISRNTIPKKKNKPYPLTTVQFQKMITNKLKLSAAQAMKIAEQLYQKGYISYPRTQTNSFPQSMDLRGLINKFKNSQHADYVAKLDHKFQPPKKGKHSDQAHVPIHPVKVAQKGDLSQKEYRIYDFILRHFLACCSQDAIGDESQVIALVGEQKFRASYLHIKQKNFLQIYPYEYWSESAFAAQIPDTFLLMLKLIENKTKPPGYLTEGDLIGLMQKNHIGTDSTIHQHIQTIQTRKYAVKEKTVFRPTNLGVSLIVTYRAFELGLAECKLRREIQQTMDQVARGEINKDIAVNITLQSFLPMFEKLQHREREWADVMRQAMQDHSSLEKVDFNQVESNNKTTSQNARPQKHFQSSTDRSQKNNSVEIKKGRKKKTSTKDISNPIQSAYKCYTCGQAGHFSTNCPSKREN